MNLIFHIVSKADWEKAKTLGEYRGDTLLTEGFIHCSKLNQVLAVANSRFRGRTDLVLVAIDPTKVRSEIKYENDGQGEFYPHIYGPLNFDAVVRCADFIPGVDGSFVLPSELLI